VDFTGASVIACARSNRHLIALERDEEIFEAVLSAYKSTPPATEESGESMFDSECDSPIAKKGRIYMGAFYDQLFRPCICNF
jgi:hypothetical protein